MNVKELKEALKNLPDDMLVILQDDPEGNGYHRLEGVDGKAIGVPDGYGFDVYHSEWTADDADMEEEEWEEFKRDNEKVVVLFP